MGISEKIKEIQDEMKRTQVNKATESHLGLLKAKIAKLRRELISAAAKKSGGGGGFAVKRSGDASVALVGPPSVGKSTLINKITNAESRTAAYQFTTLTVVPGLMEYKGAKIQILDLPGILHGASEGRGRGKEGPPIPRDWWERGQSYQERGPGAGTWLPGARARLPGARVSLPRDTPLTARS